MSIAVRGELWREASDVRSKRKEEIIKIGLAVHITKIFEYAQLVPSCCFGRLRDIVER